MPIEVLKSFLVTVVLLSLSCIVGISGTNTPVMGGTLVVLFSEANPASQYIPEGTDTAPEPACQIFDTLIARNPLDMTFHPGLAKSWEVAPDGKSITLYLREDVTLMLKQSSTTLIQMQLVLGPRGKLLIRCWAWGKPTKVAKYLMITRLSYPGAN